MVPVKKKIKRKSPEGKSTNDLILSANLASNDQVFPNILELYVPKSSIVADVTYGKGVFWRKVKKDNYILKPTDIKDGIDCRDLPYENDSIDCVVFDPPYMHTPGGTAHVNHQNYEDYYQNNSITNNGKKYYEAVLDLYLKGSKEASRVLKPKGILIIKCQDQVCANKQRLTHVDIINGLSGKFIVEDIFVMVRKNKPGVSRMKKQFHARKNHSYFLVFRKL